MSDFENSMNRLQEGFPGQRMVTLPDKLIDELSATPIVSGLVLTDIGYYPRAKYHYRERIYGSDEFILIYCVDGRGIIEVPTKQMALYPNSFCIIPPGTPHKYQTSVTDPWSIYWLHFKGGMAAAFFERFSHDGEAVLSDVLFDQKRLELFEGILDVLEAGFARHHLEYVSLNLWQLLSSFLYQTLFGGGGVAQDDPVSLAVEWMKRDLGIELSVTELAARVNCSPSHFYALFKKQMGYSPLKYFNQLRIQKSCHLLSFSDLTVKEISAQTGFDDPFYFSRLFKNVMGLSPTQYRLKYKD
ncbi:AraC family transcriptional regulator [Geofilum rubicundum]|uniref:Transcriptional regulator, AraC family n=1 Tax=Geofilum rubicundum JCM 15548 TaxID=1236989 RepID=A0A0E9LWH1_9BACT|nr:AraC family transcriptional regulator [Geofilum rubicundum]GAO29466.1 transcriptional regulator, AraC family [Geofilum rubicundum JCM 15548]